MHLLSKNHVARFALYSVSSQRITIIYQQRTCRHLNEQDSFSLLEFLPVDRYCSLPTADLSLSMQWGGAFVLFLLYILCPFSRFIDLYSVYHTDMLTVQAARLSIVRVLIYLFFCKIANRSYRILIHLFIYLHFDVVSYSYLTLSICCYYSYFS
jgi:hypothetical protein